MNYDPNLVRCGRMATQTVKLVFGQWDYRKEVLIDVSGNCTGLVVIDVAIDNFYQECGDEIELTDANENVLICEDDEQKGEDWLKDMLISAEILSITPN